jgi:hypothetical protein
MFLYQRTFALIYPFPEFDSKKIIAKNIFFFILIIMNFLKNLDSQKKNLYIYLNFKKLLKVKFLINFTEISF